MLARAPGTRSAGGTARVDGEGEMGHEAADDVTPSDRAPSAGSWRKPVHIAFVAPALLLRWLPFPGVVTLALAAVLFNALVLPRIAWLAALLYRDAAREQEGARYTTVRSGIFWYPVTVLAAVLLFPAPIAAASWGFLAVGDGAAAVVGERVPLRRWAWNPRKSVGGSAAFFACGAATAVFLFLFVRGNPAASPPWWRDSAVSGACLAVGGGALAARVAAVGLVAAVVESLPVPHVDDNVTVPLATGTLLLASFMV